LIPSRYFKGKGFSGEIEGAWENLIHVNFVEHFPVNIVYSDTGEGSLPWYLLPMMIAFPKQVPRTEIGYKKFKKTPAAAPWRTPDPGVHPQT